VNEGVDVSDAAEFVRLEADAESDGAVVTIRIDRAPLNALSRQVREELRAAAQHVSRDPTVRAVVVYGGPKLFAAGADVKEMADMSLLDMVEEVEALQSSLTTVARIPKPTVAAITGFALGGGLELALCADFRVAASSARLGQPEIALGIIPGAGGTQRLPRLIGQARAKDLIYTGRQVRADEALAIGLVDKVVEPDDVYDEALTMARSYARGAAQALRAAKEAIDEGLATDLVTGLALERHLFSGLFGTEDRDIGMTSLLENGPGKAEFLGR
jgi:enoyl-CoA hydratase/carnithine racemase